MSAKKKRNILVRWAVIFMLGGLLSFVVSLLIAETNQSGFWVFLKSVLSDIGLTLFVGSIFGLILQTAESKEYFQEQFEEVISQMNYLKRMDSDALKNIQTNVMKALSGNQEIDREGSFLNYFNEKLHRFISEPYREDVSGETIVKEVRDGMILVEEQTSYVCRGFGGKIQATAKWGMDAGEVEKKVSASIVVKPPFENETSLWSYDAQEQQNFEEARAKNLSYEVERSLSSHNVDKLRVTIRSSSWLKLDQFFYWQMAHPTRNFVITITFPEDLMIQCKPMVMHGEQVVRNQTDGYFSVRYDSWMLPTSGIIWKFSKKIPSKT